MRKLFPRLRSSVLSVTLSAVALFAAVHASAQAPAAGAYTLTAVAADDRGLTITSAPVSVFVNRPPTASPGGPYSA
jgi:hypothetical protein